MISFNPLTGRLEFVKKSQNIVGNSPIARSYNFSSHFIRDGYNISLPQDIAPSASPVFSGLTTGLTTNDPLLNRIRINNPSSNFDNNAVINIGGEYDGSLFWLNFPPDAVSVGVFAQARNDGSAIYYAGFGAFADTTRNPYELVGGYTIARGANAYGLYAGGGESTQNIGGFIYCEGYADYGLTIRNNSGLGLAIYLNSPSEIIVSETPAGNFKVSGDGSISSTGSIRVGGSIVSDSKISIANSAVILETNGDIKGNNLIASGGLSLKYVSKDVDYTLQYNDFCVDFYYLSQDTYAYLPTANGYMGKIYVIKKSAPSFNLIITPYGTETIDGANSLTLSTQYASAMIISDGVNWKIMAKN